ncbi:hypothetical protein AVEN_274004-1 [Araneus ventricosus]|uniref:Uncharacterized protein n=1 Tax=Araneus ventricosus TaxID=182803 RepID=A0A4Y2JYW3_ARAVE|nr:hypothetical protein AVEN_274004-1 [Araneus ventricosus]
MASMQCFLKSLKAYKNVNESISKASLQKFSQHLWYLTDEIAVLALDDDVDEETKLKMVANLHRENFSTHEERYIPSKEELCGSLYVTPVVTKVLDAVRTLDRFGISDGAGAAIVSAAFQDVGIISESNVLNVAGRNKIRRGRTKARTTLLSQVIKDYDHDQFGLYSDGRKDKTLSMEDNRRKVIIEEHISLVKEPGCEYIGHVSVNFGRAQIIGNNIYSSLSCVNNDIDVTKLVATEHLSTQVSKEVLYVTWN